MIATLSSALITTMIRVASLFAIVISGYACAQNAPVTLLEKFKQQHQQLVPVVAVADIYLGCYLKRHNEPPEFSVNHMVTTLSRDFLAEQAIQCLGEDVDIQSEQAVNLGLFGCFYGQMTHLSDEEREMNLQEVDRLIVALSKTEKNKSFSQCVNDHAVEFVSVK